MKTLSSYLPGLLISGAIATAALALQGIEAATLGTKPLEALVLAIILGAILRSFLPCIARYQRGIDVTAKIPLEIAITLLGLSVSTATLRATGPSLIAAIAAIVLCAIALSYSIGRVFGLAPRLAILVACGNAICGNSAIAAIAPVIGAAGAEVASAIAFTALFGVALVIALPLAIPLLHLTAAQYGTFAGLTVYAVPQVLAATVGAGAAAVQTGTIVKLLRVLMLGPVIFGLSCIAHPTAGTTRHKLRHILPWFIIGFAATATLRATGHMPAGLLAPAASLTNLLTILSMAALGLNTDLRAIARVGPKLTSVVCLSLLLLAALSLTFIRMRA